jgi:AtzE family amidohydrolase
VIGPSTTASAIAAAVAHRDVSATDIVDHALRRVNAGNPRYNAFTAITEERARRQAAALDARIAAGAAVGPLAGVPFAVKNLFDINGVTTLAGSLIDADKAPAADDATVVRRLTEAGAVLIGALNMSQYAYGYTNENTHYGPPHNPHDLDRAAGGSSGGSGAAVASGMVPVALGSDTNGSIRIPSSLCGIFGLKPTFGRLSRHGVRLFAASFDHVGPMARSVRDVAAFYDVMQGPDPADSVCMATQVEPSLPILDADEPKLRIGIADGYFAPSGADEAVTATEHIAQAVDAHRRITIPEAARARAAAILITAAESGNLHLASLRARAKDFDPTIHDRFLAAALVPATWLVQAQRFRRWYAAQVRDIFRDIDILLAPATPCTAPLLGQEHVMAINGVPMTARAHLGMFTQPLSFIGLPIVVVPVRTGSLPIGVQIVAAPWREADALRFAYQLERDGVVSAVLPQTLG